MKTKFLTVPLLRNIYYYYIRIQGDYFRCLTRFHSHKKYILKRCLYIFAEEFVFQKKTNFDFRCFLGYIQIAIYLYLK